MAEPASKRAAGGKRRSSMLTFQRRMIVARMLIRGTATTLNLIAEARSIQGPEAYPPDAHAAVRHDIAALKDMFGCSIRYLPPDGYLLEEPGDLALLDLPDDELEALGFLVTTFEDGTLPNASIITSLLERIVQLLPEPRRQKLQRASPHPRIDNPRSARNPARPVLEKLKRMLGRTQIEFEYVSSYASQGQTVRHQVAPHDLVFRDGHTYLDAQCLNCGIHELVNTHVLYRVDRIVPTSLKSLYTQLPVGLGRRHPQRLRYWLSPLVAGRRDIAIWFANSTIDFQEDGSAMVTAETHDLWQARQILIRYREHCRVEEPAELASMLRESAHRMVNMYTHPSEDTA